MSRLIAGCLLILLAAFVGCGPSTAPENTAPENTTANSSPAVDLHDTPLTDDEIQQLHDNTSTWQTAVEHVQSFRDEIEKETTSGTPAKAHRALDLLDHVLKRLPEVAESSQIPKDAWQAISESGQSLREAFNQIHANIDDGKSPDFAKYADQINEAIQKLTSVSAPEKTTNDTP